LAVTTHPKFDANIKIWYSVMIYHFLKDKNRELNWDIYAIYIYLVISWTTRRLSVLNQLQPIMTSILKSCFQPIRYTISLPVSRLSQCCVLKLWKTKLLGRSSWDLSSKYSNTFNVEIVRVRGIRVNKLWLGGIFIWCLLQNL
jgi:hypothetical protein